MYGMPLPQNINKWGIIMKRRFIKVVMLSALSLPLALPAFAAPESYTLDPSHTNIIWFANHFGFSSPSGKFTAVKGTVSLDEDNTEASKVNVIITLGSVITGVEKLDEHLKTDAFFDIAKFPTASFVSDNVNMTGKDTAVVHGNLILHGITKPVILDVTLNKIGENPITHKKTVGFSATTTIKRSDFGMNYGVPGIGDDVKIMIEAEANAS